MKSHAKQNTYVVLIIYMYDGRSSNVSVEMNKMAN